MLRNSLRKAVCVGCTLPLAPLLALLFGCEGAGWTGFSLGSAEDDVVSVTQYYVPLMWLHDADGRVIGFRTRVYLVSGRTSKGVFGKGTIAVTMNRLRRRAAGGYDRELAYEWTLDEQATAGFRVAKQSKLGESYGFFLRWPPELDLMGRRIEIAFQYRRPDGRVIRGTPRQFLVPVPPGFPLPREEEALPERTEAQSRPSVPPAPESRPP